MYVNVPLNGANTQNLSLSGQEGLDPVKPCESMQTVEQLHRVQFFFFFMTDISVKFFISYSYNQTL